MRMLIQTAAVLAVAQGALGAQFRPVPQQPFIQAGQLVREVVYNELNDHQAHGYWRYWIEHHTPTGARIEDRIETADGPVTRVVLSNGRPLSTEGQHQEQARLDHLLTSPSEQARHRQEYAEDEARIGRIVALLPDAFLYEYDGQENGCYRLRFRPNPNYPPRSIEARIFHGMSGAIWVDARYRRLARLDGHVEDNVDFGYGILGRLNKGGWFQLQRIQVSPTDWKTERLEIHMCGRALLVKSFARDTSERRGGFAPVPPAMNLAQGVSLLNRTLAQTESRIEAQTEIRDGISTPAPPRAILSAPAAFSVR